MFGKENNEGFFRMRFHVLEMHKRHNPDIYKNAIGPIKKLAQGIVDQEAREIRSSHYRGGVWRIFNAYCEN